MRSIAKIGIYILISSLFSGKNIIITQLKISNITMQDK